MDERLTLLEDSFLASTLFPEDPGIVARPRGLSGISVAVSSGR
jgi:hypothetical protein